MGILKPNVERMRKKKDVKGLIKTLKPKDSFVRYSAVVALSRIGKPAIEPLISVHACSHL